MDDTLAAIREYIRSTWVPDFEWAQFENPGISARLGKPLSECRVGLVSSSGVYLNDSQTAFLENEGTGDHSFRVVPLPLNPSRIAIAHEHYDHQHADKDLNCVLPLGALEDLEREGKIGGIANRVYTIMGYIPNWRPLVAETAPEIARCIREDNVDVMIYAPV